MIRSPSVVPRAFSVLFVCGVAYGQLPSVPGFKVEVYADVQYPGFMTFDPAGVMYVGYNYGSSYAYIRRVGIGGDPVEPYGAEPTPDPDAVMYDPTGTFSGTPGSVLVGGLCGGGGCISAILPDETVITVWGPTSAFLNPAGMAYDADGRLLIADDDGHQVVVSVDGALPTTLIDYPAAHAFDVAVDPMNRIYVSGIDGMIRVYDSAGELLNDNLASGLGSFPPLAFGTGGAFGTDLYTINDPDGTLLRIASSGSTTVLGTGIAPSLLEFGPDGALYAAEKPNDRILRITPLGDCDGDMDIDFDDLTSIVDAGCIGGPDVPSPPDCECADMDEDGDVDLCDLALFQIAFTGPW